jgi:hypothetical protein
LSAALRSKRALGAERHLFVAATADHQLAGVGVADSRLDPSARVAQRRNHIQGRQPRVVDRTGGLDQLFSPGYRLIGLDRSAEPPRIAGDRGGDIQITVVGGQRNAVRRLASSRVTQS